MKTKKSHGKKFLSLSPDKRDREVANFDVDIDLKRDTKPLNAKRQIAFERWQGKTTQGKVARKMTTSGPSKRKPWNKMNTAELAKATKQFDTPVRFEDTRPLAAAQRARFNRARKSGGPAVQNVYALGLDPTLMELAAKFAKRKKITLTQLVERGVRGVLAFDG